MRPGPTSSPASRRTRPNVTTCRTIARALSGSSASLLDELRESAVADRLQVLVVLEDRPERRLDDARLQLLAPESVERTRPVDRLRDAGRLRQVEAPQSLHERRRLRREPVRQAGDL